MIKNAQKIQVRSGTYTGDSTQNRAVAHGGITIPKAVIIWARSNGWTGFITDDDSDYCIQINFGTGFAVTAMDTTNFYIGNTAAGYDQSLNNNLAIYYFIAFF